MEYRTCWLSSLFSSVSIWFCRTPRLRSRTSIRVRIFLCCMSSGFTRSMFLFLLCIALMRESTPSSSALSSSSDVSISRRLLCSPIFAYRVSSIFTDPKTKFISPSQPLATDTRHLGSFCVFSNCIRRIACD